MLADTAYGGDANVEYAKSQGIELISPVPGNITGERGSVASETAETSETSVTSETSESTETSKASEVSEVSEASEASEGDSQEMPAPENEEDSSKRFSLADFQDRQGRENNSLPHGE
jgi:hypothetical protein